MALALIRAGDDRQRRVQRTCRERHEDIVGVTAQGRDQSGSAVNTGPESASHLQWLPSMTRNSDVGTRALLATTQTERTERMHVALQPRCFIQAMNGLLANVIA